MKEPASRPPSRPSKGETHHCQAFPAIDFLGALNPHLSDYDADVNKWLVFYCVRHTPQTKDLPDELVEAFARYPEMMVVK